MTANFIADLTRGGPLFSVIIIYDKARVNDSWNPAEQCQNEAEEETRNAASHKHGKGRQHHAKEIT